jgi:hypothetical protein
MARHGNGLLYNKPMPNKVRRTNTGINMAKKKWTNAEVDEWWDKYLAIDSESYLSIKTSNEFTVFKLRFGMYVKRRKYIPERVKLIMSKLLQDFCGLPSSDVYQGQYIDAFGLSCSIRDFTSAKLAYDLIEDKEGLQGTEIPKYFFKWFEKQSRLTNGVTDTSCG